MSRYFVFIALLSTFLSVTSIAWAQPIQPGDVLISNRGANNVQLLRPSTGAVSTLVTVPGNPIGLALDTTGIRYINVNDGIYKYDPNAGILPQ